MILSSCKAQRRPSASELTWFLFKTQRQDKAIPDHGSLGSQQNRGPVMVCNPVFNNFSPGLLRPDNYAMGQYDGGRRDRLEENLGGLWGL